MRSNVFVEDCVAAMRTMADGCFDLAIVDPPYGIGISSNPVRQKHEKKNWDDAVPGPEYFRELFRVSKNQIIWGGNYFDLPATQGFIIWDKVQPMEFTLAMVEFAWSSYQRPAKMVRYPVLTERNKIHPTQKPVYVYRWILKHYATPGDTILDTHLGSGSARIAAYEMGFDFTGYEIDPAYASASQKRFDNYTLQKTLF